MRRRYDLLSSGDDDKSDVDGCDLYSVNLVG